MPERSVISQTVQIGVESLATPGTAVAASKKLQSLSIEPSPNLEVGQFRAAGNKFRSLTALGKEWVEADLSGRATYDEIIYPFASVLTTPSAPTTVQTTGKQWVFKPANSADDSPATFTVERGNTTFAERFTGGIIREFGMAISRDGVDLSGSMIGQAFTTGISLTAAPTSPPLVPILPTGIDVFMNSTWATIGTTKLGRLLSYDFTVGDRYNPVWVLDSTKPSYAATVEGEPSYGLGLTVAADSVGMGLLADARTGKTSFVRLVATGPQIGAGPAVYSMTIDMAVKVVDTGGYGDEDGLQTIDWSFVNVYDTTFDGGTGGGLKITVVNSMAAL